MTGTALTITASDASGGTFRTVQKDEWAGDYSIPSPRQVRAGHQLAVLRGFASSKLVSGSAEGPTASSSCHEAV